MTSLRKFFVHYSHFFTGRALSLLLSLISFPILTRLMSPEEYGVLSLVNSTIIMLVAVGKAGLSDGIIRYYREYQAAQGSRDVFASTVLIRGIVLAGLVALAYVLLIPYIYPYLNISRAYLSAFLIMGATLFLRPLNLIVFNIMRARENTLLYTSIGFIEKFATVFLSLVFFVYVARSLYDYFLGVVLAELVVSFILFAWLKRDHGINGRLLSGSLSIELIKFGAPLLAAEMLYLLLAYADRYMLAAYKGEAVLGLYSVGYNLASYIGTLITFSLSFAVVPIYVSVHQTEGARKTREFLERCLHYFLIGVIPIAIGYAAVARDLLVILASDKYAAAATFSPVILVGVLFLGVNNILNAGLYLQKKTMALFIIMFVAVGLNVGLNMALIPTYSVMGAAVSTLIAAMTSTALTILLSFRYMPITLRLKDSVHYGVLFALLYLVLARVNIGEAWLDLAAKVAISVGLLGPFIFVKEKMWQWTWRRNIASVRGDSTTVR